MPKRTVMILGGTTEARALADQLVEVHGDDLRVITSLAGRTSSPTLPKGEVREGGFGGADGMAAYMRDNGIDMLVDATHPFAAQISKHAAEAAAATGTPQLMLVRPAWVQKPGDRWIHVANMDEAAAQISRRSDACLITTGINDLDAFIPIVTTKLFVRLIEKPSKPIVLQDAEIIIGTPPYKKDDEVALLQMMGIDLMVTKNAGGIATYAKIEAARQLGIEVIMIDRPPLPKGDRVEDVAGALAAVKRTLALE
tara:strand:- start:14163 stop:14924 length:762 start_codon:yes stop_codon:yes gene_type:complete